MTSSLVVTKAVQLTNQPTDQPAIQLTHSHFRECRTIPEGF